MEHEHLIQGNYYHIFNRGNNSCNLFEQPAEYEHFLWLYDKYISPVADTLAWALMRNHFHLLVYIKKDVVYKYSIETLNRISPDKIWFEEHKWETVGLSELSENLFDADRSGDAVRSEGKTDLSACAAPDNVKLEEYNVNVDRIYFKQTNFKQMEHEPLVQGNYYHIFNRGNNSSNLFSKPEEYGHFLHLYDKYILPIADTFAWALMRNHFHLLVHIKSNVVYKYSMPELESMHLSSCAIEERKWETMELDSDRALQLASTKVLANHKIPVPHKHFSHLFNAYSRYLQIRTGRTGNLFERPFKRKIIDTGEYLKTVVLYIHNNPVHHGFCSHPLEYPWTSYLTSISEKPTKLKRDEIIKLFGNKENFEQQHNQEMDIAPIEKWLEIAPSDFHDYDLSNPDADRSGDAVRSEEHTTDDFDFDLSACEAPDNVKILDDNVKILDDNVKMMKDGELN